MLASRRYERRSLIVTSNKPLSAWGEILGDDMAGSKTATSAPAPAARAPTSPAPRPGLKRPSPLRPRPAGSAFATTGALTTTSGSRLDWTTGDEPMTGAQASYL